MYINYNYTVKKILLAYIIAFCLALTSAKAALFDWDLATNPSANVWQYNNITVTVTPAPTNTASSVASVDTGPATGGVATPPNTLQLTNGNTATHDASPSFTVTVDFTGLGPVQNVAFSLYDIDQTKSAFEKTTDSITNIQATLSGGGIAVNPTVTPPGGATYAVTNNGLANLTLTGNASNTNTAAAGNALLDFGAQSISQVTFTYTDTNAQTESKPGVISLIGMSSIIGNSTQQQDPPAAPEAGTWIAALAAVGFVLGSRRFAIAQA